MGAPGNDSLHPQNFYLNLSSAELSKLDDQTWTILGSKFICPEKTFGSEEAKSWAVAFLDLLNNENVPTCVLGGTLLGLVRDSTLIAWDNDLDFVAPRRWFLSGEGKKFRDYCLSLGFVVRFRGAPLFPTLSLYREGYKATLAAYLPVGSMNYRAFERIPRFLFSERECHEPARIEALGASWPVPHQPEEILDWKYISWREPIKSDNDHDFYKAQSLTSKWARQALQGLNLFLSSGELKSLK